MPKKEKKATEPSMLPVLRQPTASGSGGGSAGTAQRFPRRRVFPTLSALPPGGLENMHPGYLHLEMAMHRNTSAPKKVQRCIYLSLHWLAALIFA